MEKVWKIRDQNKQKENARFLFEVSVISASRGPSWCIADQNPQEVQYPQQTLQLFYSSAFSECQSKTDFASSQLLYWRTQIIVCPIFRNISQSTLESPR